MTEMLYHCTQLLILDSRLILQVRLYFQATNAYEKSVPYPYTYDYSRNTTCNGRIPSYIAETVIVNLYLPKVFNNIAGIQ